MKCEACGQKFSRDPDFPGLEERACDCSECARCGKEFRADDEAGPQIAATDELAAKFDPGDMGMCDACWATRVHGERK